MRRIARSGLGAAVVVLVALGAAGPALAGGGGHGGTCYEVPPVLDAGWVAVGDSCFSPEQIEVQTGHAVSWSLEGQSPHTVTFDGGPDAGTLTSDGFAMQFNQPGTYAYACTIHPGMVGTVRAVGEIVNGPALQVLGREEPLVTSGGRTSVITDSVPMRIEFSPLAAVIVLAIGLPLSLGTAMRLVGVVSPRAGYRLRVPWEAKRRPREPARR